MCLENLREQNKTDKKTVDNNSIIASAGFEFGLRNTINRLNESKTISTSHRIRTI